jgi:CRP/FNR family transcriptional regulator, cyclic AMP receptor protein
MRAPYGFELSENCHTCKLRAAGFFCQVPSTALNDLDSMVSPSTYPEGAILFVENQKSRGIYLLCEGEVKLSMSASDGKTMIVRIVKAGETLGLLAELSGNPYEVTAETLHPCQVVFIRSADFLRFITQHPEAYQNMVKQLTAQYRSVFDQLRSIALSASVPGRLAKLLLDWSSESPKTKSGTRIKVPLTHEEMGERIGTTRETVTRTLGDFKTRHLITLHGSTLTIPSRAALESFVNA